MRPQFSLLAEVARHQARVRGRKIALRFAGDVTTYASLYQRMCRVGNGLRAAGVDRRDRVIYLGKNTAAYYEILFGTAAIGAVLTPLNWRLADPEIDRILRDARPAAMFASQGMSNRMRSLSTAAACRLLPLDKKSGYDAWRDAQSSVEPVSEIAPEDVAVQLYTSGTTGKPKGVMLSHRGLLAFRSLPPEAQPEWNRWTDDDVSLIVMPQFHVGGTGFGLQTLCAGAKGLVMSDFDVGGILDFIEHERLSKIFTVPSALQMILGHPRARDINYQRIRTLVYGASPVPLSLLREAMAVFKCGFVQQYGMTETAGTICVLPPEDHSLEGNARMLSAGKPLPGVEIRILDSDGGRQPIGQSGEIAIRSPTLMTGYWGSPEATAAAIDTDGFFLSGDAGYLDEDGYLHIQDRIKDMIVSGGENVYPAEVEAALREHPDIRDVVVIGVPDEKWGEAVKAVVVSAESVRADAAEIIAWARSRLAGYKLPKSIDFVCELPRNASGKILRRALRDPYWVGRDRKVN